MAARAALLLLLAAGAATAAPGSPRRHALREVTPLPAPPLRGPLRAAFDTAAAAAALGAAAAAAGAAAPLHERHNALQAVNAPAMRSEPDPRVTLAVDGTKLRRGRGQWFTVSWSGVPGPDYGDWVALLPAGAEPVWSAAPLKFQIAARAPGHLAGGSGRLKCVAVGCAVSSVCCVVCVLCAICWKMGGAAASSQVWSAWMSDRSLPPS